MSINLDHVKWVIGGFCTICVFVIITYPEYRERRNSERSKLIEAIHNDKDPLSRQQRIKTLKKTYGSDTLWIAEIESLLTAAPSDRQKSDLEAKIAELISKRKSLSPQSGAYNLNEVQIQLLEIKLKIAATAAK